MKERSDQAVRDALADFFGILQYKVMHGVLTVDDVRSILFAIESSGGISATVSDLAGYYHTSEDNIRHVIHRNFLPAPKRRVYHDFGAFREKVPKSWREKSLKPDD